MNPIDEFDRIRIFIREVGQKAKQLRQDKFEVIQKGHLDFVTTVDRDIDRVITDQFQVWFPDDGIITEENPDSLKLWQQNYRRMGLLEYNQPTMGWIYAPEADLMFYGGAAIGGLFTQNADNYPIQFIPQTPPLRDRHKLLVGDKDQRKYGEAFQNLIPDIEFYNMGGFGLKVMEAIAGNTELYFYLNRRVKLWDTVAPLAMTRFAGLTACDLHGGIIQFIPDLIDPETLAHKQDMVIGWSQYVDLYLPKLVEMLDAIKADIK
jgi:3'(2'), 5'-bisphosphate nucleotidase